MSDLVLEDWDLDFSMGEGVFWFGWTENKGIKVYVTLNFDVECEWKHFNGRDYEEETRVAYIADWSSFEELYTNGGPVEGQSDDDLWPEDIKAMEAVIEEEYPKYLKEVADDY